MSPAYRTLGNDSWVNFTIVVSWLLESRSQIQEHHANGNIISFCVIFFLLISADDIRIVRLKAWLILRFLYSIHICMLKISCRLNLFLIGCYFCAKVFHVPGSKNVLSYYSYCTIFLKSKIFFFSLLKKREKVWPCLLGTSNTQGSA